MQSNGPGYTRMHVWGMVAAELGFLSRRARQKRSETVLNRFRHSAKLCTWTDEEKGGEPSLELPCSRPSASTRPLPAPTLEHGGMEET